MKKNLFTIFLVLICAHAFAQGVSINETGAAPHESAILDVSSSNKGFLPPRMTTAQRDAIVNPAIGLFIFNTENNCMELFTNMGWFSSCNTAQNATYAIPAGTILPFAGDVSNMPSGFLLCDGAQLDTNTYHDLFQAVGYAWGGANNMFNLPDLRGQFLRGADLGSGGDPNAAARTAMNPGGNTGGNVGSVQSDQFAEHNHGGGNHNHTFSHLWIVNNTGNPDGALDSHTGTTQNRRYWRGNVTETFTTHASGEIIQNQGGAETRPKNAAVNYVICYSSALVDFITEETDPIFAVSVASGITQTDTANWNNKQNELNAGLGITIINDTISINLAALDFLMPAGTILPFAGDTSKVPNGFLICDGTSLDTTDFNPLFQVIGYNWGGSGQNFNLPDLRGQFLRGTDLNSGNDPNAANRVGGNSNDGVGSSQIDAFAEHNHGGGDHNHTFSHLWIVNNTGNPDGALDSHTGGTQNRRYWRGNVTETFTTNSSGQIIQNQGGAETRPKNVAVNYIICYTNSLSQINHSGGNSGGGNNPTSGNLSDFNNDIGFITTENDPLYTASVASGITATDTANWNNKQEQLTAGTGISIVGNTISATNSSSNSYYLGQDTLGGIVFYIYLGSDGQQHGLIVSKTETTAQWQSTTSTTNAERTWDGAFNMNLMSNSPAKNWVVSNFSAEWYLPSIDELTLLWQNRFHVNKALFNMGETLVSGTGTYWTSNETTSANGATFRFFNGYVIGDFKTTSHRVRAVREF